MKWLKRKICEMSGHDIEPRAGEIFWRYPMPQKAVCFRCKEKYMWVVRNKVYTLIKEIQTTEKERQNDITN